MFKYRIPYLVRFLYSGVCWRMSKKERAIYLTFDDGCVPEVTPQVLDLLDTYGVKATFFCVGENVYKYPELFKQLSERGHRVGCHTYNHLQGFKTSTDVYVENAIKANELIKSNLFRPPHGKMTFTQKRILKRDFKIIFWDLLTNDFDKTLLPAEIMHKIRKYTRNGSIVVFHDSLKAQKNMLAVLPQAIEFWKSEGYEFKLFE